MTRKEYETICRVLKDAGGRKHYGASNEGAGPSTPAGMHALIAKALCKAFELTGEARKLFLERAGVTAPVTR